MQQLYMIYCINTELPYDLQDVVCLTTRTATDINQLRCKGKIKVLEIAPYKMFSYVTPEQRLKSDQYTEAIIQKLKDYNRRYFPNRYQLDEKI